MWNDARLCCSSCEKTDRFHGSSSWNAAHVNSSFCMVKDYMLARAVANVGCDVAQSHVVLREPMNASYSRLRL